MDLLDLVALSRLEAPADLQAPADQWVQPHLVGQLVPQVQSVLGVQLGLYLQGHLGDLRDQWGQLYLGLQQVQLDLCLQYRPSVQWVQLDLALQLLQLLQLDLVDLVAQLDLGLQSHQLAPLIQVHLADQLDLQRHARLQVQLILARQVALLHLVAQPLQVVLVVLSRPLVQLDQWDQARPMTPV